MAETKVIYPLQKISTLECRFQKFSELSDACKMDLPILHTSDYKKYLKQDGGYNLYTRIYTVLWGSSYTYGWDVGNGWHEWTDIATAEWTPVYAIADGEVVVADNILGRWNEVSIQHTIDGKTVISDYAHLSKILVKKGDKVTVGTKIGEVGATWNASGNHLHFQIDLQYKFYPYYYDYTECPYSYDKITETGLCFSQLQQHTIDPLLFLETQGGVLSDIQTQTTSTQSTSNTTAPTNSEDSINNIDIFSVTVYQDSPVAYIKKVQQILSDMGIYKGDINGNYADIEDDILAYQISRKIISSASDSWAWYWGPKTRAQAKIEYTALAQANVSTKLSGVTEETVVKFTSKTTEKIDRTDLLTRDQIDLKEVEDFLKKYNVTVSSDNVGGNIKVGESKTILVSIQDMKGKDFKGSLPQPLTFEVDSWSVDVFPKSLYYFTDGKRDIKITGLKAGTVDLKINIGKKTIKTLTLRIYGENTNTVGVSVNSGKIVTASKVIVGENKTGFVVFTDKSGKAIVNLKYSWTYRISSPNNASFCVKKGNLADIQKIYKKTCSSDEYVTSYDFTYADTVGWILVFDYIIWNKSASLTLSKVDTSKSLATRSITTEIPKWLKSTYLYYNEVVSLLNSGVVTGINQWYFQQENGLKESDAKDWLINTLRYMKKNTKDQTVKNQINTKLNKLKLETVSSFNSITRQGFLEKAYNYLVLNNSSGSVSIKYKDLDTSANKMANTFFDTSTTWKDQFGQTYFRPEKAITRGEAAYFISTALERTSLPLVTTTQ